MNIDPVDPTVRRRAVAAALGEEPFDVLLAGGTVVDVGTGELKDADVGLVGPLVASVHARGARTDSVRSVDCAGRFIAPGFIDMHVHFESSMLTPGGYAAAVCPRGTTTVFADPHELANVTGVDGVRYAVEASRGLPVRFIIQAPSCVPPQPGLELSGADLHRPEVEEMLAWDEVGGLAEVMDMVGVLGADERMVGVVDAGLASGKLVSGHAAGLTGSPLQAYLAAGMTSDHEVFTEPDCLEKLRAGLTVELRGMVDAILPEIVAEVCTMPIPPTHLVAATDDLFALTLVTDGGIDHLLRRLIAHGMPVVLAYRIATYHAAYRLQRTDLGLVAAGRRADLVVLSDLEAVAVEQVWFDGRMVASDGEMLIDVVEGPSDPPLDTMKLTPITADDMRFRIEAGDGVHRVRTIVGGPITAWSEVDVTVVDGVAAVPPDHLLQVTVHRHGRVAPVPHGALLAEWGEWTGAVATTVAHDTHNLVVFGRDAEDMAIAANTVIRTGGGLAVVRDRQVLASLALPVAGILSPLPPNELAARQRDVQDAAISIGLVAPVVNQPLFQVMLSSLACLPGPHVTDRGLVDGDTGTLLGTMLV